MRYETDGITVLSAPVAGGTAPRRERERAAVASLLRGYFGAEVEVAHHPSGAPYLPGKEENISMSHSAAAAVVAIGRRSGFGIDTETQRPQLERVKSRFLTPFECERYAVPPQLLRAWCAKEAVYKAALTPGLPIAEGILLDGARAEAAGKVYRLTEIPALMPGEATVLAVEEPPVGRFAPSPSGRMHLGNIFAAVVSWLSAKSRGGRWILRIEDLDPQRSRHDYARMIEDDLAWLGLEWDEGGLEGRGAHGPYLQSLRHDIYARYLERLRLTGYTYPCRCTRSEIMATQAPHQSDGRVIYGGRCRPSVLPAFAPEPAEPHATRLYVPSREILLYDRFHGPQRFNLADDCGDFILRRADGTWAYQLAVVVDDALMGVTEVVRGADLLLSAAQQTYLYELLGLTAPRWAHVPLVNGPDGRRLSKRDRSLGMEELRARHTPAEVLGMVAALAGVNPAGHPKTLSELSESYLSINQALIKQATTSRR